MPEISETTSPPVNNVSSIDELPLLSSSLSTTVLLNRNKTITTSNESAPAEFEDKILDKILDPLLTESAVAEVNNEIDSSLVKSVSGAVSQTAPTKIVIDQVLECNREAVSTEVPQPALKPILKPLSIPSLNSCQSTKRCKILILCSGTDSVGEAMRLMYPSCEVVNVDINPKCPKLNYCVDLLTWNYKSVLRPGEFAIVWASPPCEGFSRIQTLNPLETQIRSFEKSSLVAKKVLQIIDFLAPRDYFVENPKGRLRDTPFMQKWQTYRATTSHCMFGTKYKKETDIWSKRPLTLPCCTADTPCACRHAYGTHLQSATRGALRGMPGSKLDQLHSIPSGMVRQIVEQADQSDLNCPPTPDTPDPPLTNLHILEEVTERLAYLEAFEDETPLPSLCKISLAQMFSSETQSFFLTKGTKRPRLMTFELELSQPGMTEMKSRIMVDS